MKVDVATNVLIDPVKDSNHPTQGVCKYKHTPYVFLTSNLLCHSELVSESKVEIPWFKIPK